MTKPDLSGKKDSHSQSKKPIWVPVVTALIRRGTQVLVGQRPPDDTLPGQWEFPGGKIEKGEAPAGALQRELKEELGIDAEIGQLKFSTNHAYGDVSILILFYEVKYWTGEIKKLQHSELKWIEPTEFGKLNIPEANRKALPEIISALV